MIIKYIIFFIAGIIILNYIIPIFDEALALLLSAMELLKAKISYEMTKISEKIKKLQEIEPNETQIGFSYEVEEEES